MNDLRRDIVAMSQRPIEPLIRRIEAERRQQRLADEVTRRWVRKTIAEHVERQIPELVSPAG